MGGMGWQVGGRFEREGTYVCAVLYSVASVVSDSVIPLTVAHQAPPSMGFSRQEYWSGLPFPPPGDLPDPGIEPMAPGSPALQVDSLPLSPLWYCYLLLSITTTARYKNQWKMDGMVNSLKTF